MMAMFNRLSFASKYYFLDPEGVIHLKNMPDDLRVRFWKTWIGFRKDIIAANKRGHYPSYYPAIPTVDEDPNLPQYKDLLDKGLL